MSSSSQAQPTRQEQRKAHTEAFVLRSIQYGERDLMVTLLTRDHGRISALAKNARSSRRFAGGVHPLRRAEVILDIKPGREVHLLLEMKLVRGYARIEKSYDKITIASYATELIRELTRDDQESALLVDALSDFYEDLDRVEDELGLLAQHLHHFELRLLESFGALPSLYHCHRCGLSHESFDKLQCTRTGEGLLCTACKHPGEAIGLLEPTTLAMLHAFDTMMPSSKDQLEDSQSRQQARRVIHSSIQQILQKELKSKSMLDTIWR